MPPTCRTDTVELPDPAPLVAGYQFDPRSIGQIGTWNAMEAEGARRGRLSVFWRQISNSHLQIARGFGCLTLSPKRCQLANILLQATISPKATATRLAIRDWGRVMTLYWSAEETGDPVYADDRLFYKVEVWREKRVASMIYAGNDLHKARKIFEDFAEQRPYAHLTIRQRTRVLDRWPKYMRLFVFGNWSAALRRLLG